MALRSSYVGSVAAGVAGQLLLVLSGPIAARLLGVEQRGDLAALTAWVMVVGPLGVMGVPAAITFFLGRRPDSGLLPEISRVAVAQIVALSALLALGVWSWERQAGTHIRAGVVFACAALAGWVALNYGLAVLQARASLRLFNVLRLAPALLYALGLITLFVVSGRSSVGSVLGIWALAYCIPAVVACGAGRAQIRGGRAAGPSRRQLLRFGVKAHLGNLSPVESLPLDQILVAYALSARQLGLYAVGYAFANFPRFIAQSAGMALYSSLTRNRRRHDAWKRIWMTCAGTTALNTLLGAAAFVAMPQLVNLFFGHAFASAVPIGRILLVGGVLTGARRLLTDGLRGLGFAGRSSIAELSMYPWLAGAIPILLIRYGAVGLAAALAVGYGIAAAVAATLVVRAQITSRSQPLFGLESATAGS